MKQEIPQKIVQLHKYSITGILQIIKARNTFLKKEYLYCYAVSIAFTLYLFFHKEQILNCLNALIKANLSVFPCLCGFSISGLAITIGFADKDIIKQDLSLKEYNIYQQGIAIMAINVILQLLCLGTAYIINFICNAGLNNLIPVSVICAHIINLVIILLLSVLTSVSIVMIFYVVFNLFTFGQLNSMYNTYQKFMAPKSEDNKN